MRISRLILPLTVLVIVGWCGVRVYGFVQLFFQHEGRALEQKVVLEEWERGRAGRVERIPRRVHQVWHDWGGRGVHGENAVGGDGDRGKGMGNGTVGGLEGLPPDWEVNSRGCREMGGEGGWIYTLWTETTSREFIKEHYPWFLKTYDGYRFPVQRVDSVRYFLLLHFGGIYLDLDNGCLTSLEPLLTYPTWTTDGGRGALSNNILASAPGHPFWKLLTDSLIPYNYNYFFPYVTISYASGQWFETAIWQKYHKLLRKGKIPGEKDELVRIMMDDRDGKREEWVFFSQERGGTWVNWDNYFFLWVGDHLLLEGVVVLGLVGGIWWGFSRWCGGRGKSGKRRGRYGYVVVKGEEGGV